MRSLWCHLIITLGPLCGHLEIILEALCGRSWVIFVPPWGHLGITLGSVCDQVGIIVSICLFFQGRVLLMWAPTHVVGPGPFMFFESQATPCEFPGKAEDTPYTTWMRENFATNQHLKKISHDNTLVIVVGSGRETSTVGPVGIKDAFAGSVLILVLAGTVAPMKVDDNQCRCAWSTDLFWLATTLPRTAWFQFGPLWNPCG